MRHSRHRKHQSTRLVGTLNDLSRLSRLAAATNSCVGYGPRQLSVTHLVQKIALSRQSSDHTLADQSPIVMKFFRNAGLRCTCNHSNTRAYTERRVRLHL